MSRPKVLICGSLIWAHDEVQSMLKSHADILLLEETSRESFLDALQPNGRYADIIAMYRHNYSADQVGIFDAEIINALPKTLKLIAHNGAGYDQIDVKTCRARGIMVSNTPGAVDEGTAITAIYLFLSTIRQFSIAERNARALKWKSGLKPAHDPSSVTVGILGMGGIGTLFANMIHGLQVKRIYYHNRSPKENAPEWAEYLPAMEELLRRSDVLSIHCPLTEKTTGLIGEREIRLMQPGSIIINTARGKVLNEDALIRALEDNHLYAAGLDVYPDEPHIHPRLLEYSNVTILPHMGTETQESQRAMEIRALQNIKDFFETGRIRDLVPECK